MTKRLDPAGRIQPGWPCTTRQQLAGRRFGRLTAVELSDRRASNGGAIWVCRCDCGQTREVISTNLTSGNTSSCGCLQAERTRESIRLRLKAKAKARKKRLP